MEQLQGCIFGLIIFICSFILIVGILIGKYGFVGVIYALAITGFLWLISKIFI
ncbi:MULTISPECIES: hypothetical protein [Bacillus cereus group]|uniref:hypothetical protein n=1 Tax=Bacillus cereus group TaxID=86661 RepID=UPI001596861F|nr:MULTISPECIES: hypothetical protein [Bacillus cereus group]EKS7858206.1 hypothetical protein [Bacillus cereus]